MIVSYKNTSCGWQITDSHGIVWEVTGDGSGVWTLTIRDAHSVLIWSGTKTGAAATRNRETPEGVYTRTGGTDTSTLTRTVTNPCTLCPDDASPCCDQYEIVVAGTGSSQDGTWALMRYGSQPFWSSENGGSTPAGATGAVRMFCDGHNWVIEMRGSATCVFRFESENNGCPRTSHWHRVDIDGTNDGCPGVVIGVDASTCSSSGGRESSSSSSRSRSSSSFSRSESSSSSSTAISGVVGSIASSSSSSFPPFVGCDEFSWSRPRVGEPLYFYAPNMTNVNDTQFSRMSSSAAIDLSNHHITGLSFGPSTGLDDIFILMKGDENCVETYSPGLIDADHGNPVSFTVPENAIFFTNTAGWFCNKSYSGYCRASCEKTFIEVDSHGVPTGKTHVIPQGSALNDGTGGGADFAADGFVVRNFAAGISIADLIALGFIDESGIMSFRFAHVVAGSGFVNITNMTCTAVDSSVSSVSDVSLSSLTTETPCLTDCNACCAEYIVNLSGGTYLDGTYDFIRVNATECMWQTDSSGLMKIYQVHGYWYLQISDGSHTVVFKSENCTVCPEIWPKYWSLVSNDAGGTPKLEFSVARCTPESDSSAHSQSAGVGECDSGTPCTNCGDHTPSFFTILFSGAGKNGGIQLDAACMTGCSGGGTSRKLDINSQLVGPYLLNQASACVWQAVATDLVIYEYSTPDCSGSPTAANNATITLTRGSGSWTITVNDTDGVVYFSGTGGDPTRCYPDFVVPSTIFAYSDCAFGGKSGVASVSACG